MAHPENTCTAGEEPASTTQQGNTMKPECRVEMLLEIIENEDIRSQVKTILCRNLKALKEDLQLYQEVPVEGPEVVRDDNVDPRLWPAR